MRSSGHILLSVLALCASSAAVAQPQPEPLVLKAAPLPGRFSNLLQGSGGTWLVEYGAWGEWGGARLSALRRGGQWIRVPPGSAYAWKQWLVIEGLFPLPRGEGEGEAAPPSPWDGGTRVVTQGTDDAFVRRVVLVQWKTGQRFEAPWDTVAPLPLGDGDVWLLWRCPRVMHTDGGVQETLELITWAPRTGKTRRVGRLPGEPGPSCWPSAAARSLSVLTSPPGGFKVPGGSQSFAWAQVVVPVAGGALARIVAEAGDERWVRIDPTGHVTGDSPDAGPLRLSETPADGGSPLAPLRRMDEAFLELGNATSLQTEDGRPVFGQLPGAHEPVRLTPSFGGGVALHDSLLFTDEGVFSWPPKTPRPVGAPAAK